MDKNFIVTDKDFEEIETFLEEKINDFIKSRFGEIAAKQTQCTVEYREYMDEDRKCFKDQFVCDLLVEVEFNQYKYTYDPKYGERTESVGAVFEYKGRQPFYIDGKFVSMNVFEWMQGLPIQKHEKIYGIGKDELYHMFQDLIMDC